MNKLSKRLNQLKREKQTLANEVEQEEEYLVNNLQKRLAKVCKTSDHYLPCTAPFRVSVPFALPVLLPVLLPV